MEGNAEKFLVYGLTRQEIINKIVDFEIEREIDLDYRDILENGFTGYNFVSDEVLIETYHDYFDDEINSGELE